MDATTDRTDSDANANGTTDCFEVNDMDDTTIDAGVFEGRTLLLGNKIRPRDPSGQYARRPNDRACLGDNLFLWVHLDEEDLNDYDQLGDDFAGWTFTWSFPNGDVFTTGDAPCDRCLGPAQGFAQSDIKEIQRKLNLTSDDFGLYTIDWSAPDGETGTLTFSLDFPDEGCGQGGTRESNFSNQRITSVFPIPATSGSSITVVINTDSGSISNDALNGVVRLTTVLPQGKDNIVVTMFDATGRMVGIIKEYDVNASGGIVQYPLGYLETGAYMIKVDGNGWSDSKQIIVK